MSMCLGLVTLSDANIRRVLEDPPLIWRVIAPDYPDLYEDACAGQRKHTLLSRLFGRRKGASADADLDLSENGDATDLDKAWHGIHYLLTGTAWEGDAPQNFLVSGGQAVGDIEVGYGPARVLTAEQTRKAHEALRVLTDEELLMRFDPKDMMAKEVYPEIWDRSPVDDESLEYLMEYVQVLRGLLEQAVAKKFGLVVYLS